MPISTALQILHSQLFVTVPKPTASFKDRVVIVTGGNVGLGQETARTIASLGAAKVIITSRSTAKGEEARNDIISSTKCDESTIEVWPLDLCSFESVRAFAERAQSLPRLDALICNAGIGTTAFKLAEGHESTITTNVISTFLLSLLLLPKLKETAVKFNILTHLDIVSSDTHFLTDFPESRLPGPIFETLRSEEKSMMSDRYHVSKLLEIFLVRALASSLAAAPYPVVITSSNPGFCTSSLRDEVREGSAVARWVIWLIERLVARTAEEGSRNFVIAASAGEDFHGQWVSDGKVQQVAPFVLSEEGEKVQSQVWEELCAILEEAVPGVTKGL
ncbi:Short-chain dehydrogenase/reductase SDR [Lasiodiplodia theobromae]|uniref:Short-chain dehydrogenase/reductase SDR n=1 Tax=Lasiodiplodia theobromae TaxID=45133 RepID=UPI0015C32A38|nr:Short-chain dehydrogenase/reductase SDR [Lasiodiplodia theobromae]KAF4538209.1 Short-chain dehydrogenase/reductase SDR [Lasiodiplodia theobromae]